MNDWKTMDYLTAVGLHREMERRRPGREKLLRQSRNCPLTHAIMKAFAQGHYATLEEALIELACYLIDQNEALKQTATKSVLPTLPPIPDDTYPSGGPL